MTKYISDKDVEFFRKELINNDGWTFVQKDDDGITTTYKKLYEGNKFILIFLIIR
jgi:hypothetical protein